MPNPDEVLITIQVLVQAAPAIAENVAVRATRYIEESFVDEPMQVQTVLVHTGPFTFTEAGFVLASPSNVYHGED